jgi:hypothetical protein
LPANKVSDGATNKNAATAASATITVDTTAPTCSISGNPSSWQNTNATLTLSATDTNMNTAGYKWDN